MESRPIHGREDVKTTTPRPPEGDWLGTPYLRFTREGPFGVCTLDRPEARNAMTPAMYFGIRYAVRHVDADPDLAGLLITGTGDVFAPGGDMGGGDGSDDWLTFEFGSALGMDVTPFETLRQSVKPVVSAVNGLCQGGGLQIALCSDMTVISDRATFRVPELLRGIADTYYSQMLARLIGPMRTRDLMFTGRTLTAAEAQEWGMVTSVVPHDELLDAAREVLGQCCRTAPAARSVVKSSLATTWACSTVSVCRPATPRQRRSKASARQGAPVARVGASRPEDGRAPLIALGRARLTDLTEESGLPRTTVSRLLGQLAAVDAVDRVGTHYRLGPGLLALGQRRADGTAAPHCTAADVATRGGDTGPRGADRQHLLYSNVFGRSARP